MVSRMERYYKSTKQTSKRTEMNRELYRNIYDVGEYSNIEGIATIEKSNQVDITKIKKMLKNREDYQRQKDLRTLMRKKEPTPEARTRTNEFEDSNRVYDIGDILAQAKEEKNVLDNRYRSLGNTNYDILKSLKINDQQEVDDYLSKTMTNTRVLKSLNDNELSLNLLDDLKSENTTMISNKDMVRQLLEDAKNEEQKKKEETKKVKLDTSFFTSSMNFQDDDFEEVNKMIKANKAGKKIKKIIGMIVLIAITVGIVFFVYNLIK